MDTDSFSQHGNYFYNIFNKELYNDASPDEAPGTPPSMFGDFYETADAQGMGLMDTSIKSFRNFNRDSVDINVEPSILGDGNGTIEDTQGMGQMCDKMDVNIKSPSTPYVDGEYIVDTLMGSMDGADTNFAFNPSALQDSRWEWNYSVDNHVGKGPMDADRNSPINYKPSSFGDYHSVDLSPDGDKSFVDGSPALTSINACEQGRDTAPEGCMLPDAQAYLIPYDDVNLAENASAAEDDSADAVTPSLAHLAPAIADSNRPAHDPPVIRASIKKRRGAHVKEKPEMPKKARAGRDHWKDTKARKQAEWDLRALEVQRATLYTCIRPYYIDV
jgi:hypothetical protein